MTENKLSALRAGSSNLIQMDTFFVVAFCCCFLLQKEEIKDVFHTHRKIGHLRGSLVHKTCSELVTGSHI